MNYKFLLLDIDDTILDFQAAENYAFDKTHRDNKIDYNEKDFCLYKTINKNLWKDYENGKIQMHEILDGRFIIYLKGKGLQINAVKFQKDYENNLADNATLIDENIIQTLTQIRQQAKIYSVTNGIEFVQRKRLKDCGLDKFFNGYFISQVIGYNKPSKEFFDYVEQNIPDFNKKECLLVGDSMTADMPAAMFGFDTCLINRDNKCLDNYKIKPKFQINNFSELVNFFKGK